MLTKFQNYTKAKAAAVKKEGDAELVKPNRRSRETIDDPMGPKIPGALLLQSILALPAPHNQVILDRYSGGHPVLFTALIFYPQHLLAHHGRSHCNGT